MAPRLMPPLDITSRSHQYTERSDGLHLSRIYGDLLHRIDSERYGGPPNFANFYAGLIFERALELAWMDKERLFRPGLIRPGEVTKDGIIGTPDAYDCIKGRPEEYKFTKKSCRQDISDPKYWHYWVQLKAYAYMLGCNGGALYICHVNGNYSRDDNDPDSGYTFRAWEDEWTDLQLEENWAMLIGHARRNGWLK